MQTLALRFQDYGKGEQPAPSELSFQAAQDLQKFRGGNLQVAFVFPLEHIKQLQEFKDAVIDRGQKNPHKGLSEYLLGQEKIPLIDGNYSDVNKVKIGVRSLLENAARRGESNTYLIGVEANIFHKLYAEASDTVSISRKGRRPSKAFKATLTRDFAKETLLHLIDRYRIPPRLSQAYVGGARDVQWRCRWPWPPPARAARCLFSARPAPVRRSSRGRFTSAVQGPACLFKWSIAPRYRRTFWSLSSSGT